jgi:outer membrane protein TolC
MQKQRRREIPAQPNKSERFGTAIKLQRWRAPMWLDILKQISPLKISLCEAVKNLAFCRLSVRRGPLAATIRLSTCVCAGLLCLASTSPAQTSLVTNTVTRRLSLEESIRLALQHNLGIQIERYTPQIAQFNLENSYGYYDPVFKSEAEESFNRSPGSFNPRFQVTAPASETSRDSLRSGITGYAPTGLRYNLFADLGRTNRMFPQISGGRYLFFPNRPEYRAEAGIELSQPLLRNFWIDAPRTQIKVNKLQVKISKLALELLVMETVRKVQETYYDLTVIRQIVKVQETALELAQRLLDDNKERLKIGVMAPLDEKQAQAQLATARTDLLSAQNQITLVEDALKNLLSDEYGPWHDVAIEPADKLFAMPESFNLGESWENGLRFRPDFNQLKEELAKQNIILKFRHNQLFPSLDLVGSLGWSGLDTNFNASLEQLREGDNPRWGVGAVLTVPLTFRSERSNYRLAKAAQKQALLRLKQLEQDIVLQINDAVKLAQRNYERVAAARQAREFAEAALEAEQQKLESGKSTTFVVLELQTKLTRARSAEIQALADYNKSLADLYFREGTTLERNRIELK